MQNFESIGLDVISEDFCSWKEYLKRIIWVSSLIYLFLAKSDP